MIQCIDYHIYSTTYLTSKHKKNLNIFVGQNIIEWQKEKGSLFFILYHHH